MAIDLILFLTMLGGTAALDAVVRPRAVAGRQWGGRLLHLVIVTGWFGGVLTIFGSVLIAAVLTLAWMAVLTIASNSKYPVLGEPLVFSDVVLIAAVARHPRFYFTAVSTWQRCMLVVAAAGAALALAALFVASVAAHLVGLGLLLLAAATVRLALRTRSGSRMALFPDAEVDVARLGLVTTLVLYWLRWRDTPDPPALPAMPHARAASPPDIVIIVQCESFADPAALTGKAALALPGLTSAQAAAWQWGNLHVSGFGAYTMRTEYGVLFGRGEQALGFRRYDPFLTARREASYALPARLRPLDYRCLFVHPHDMRFYGRDRLMPAIGFDRLIGQDGFAPVAPGDRYVTDKALGASLGDLIDQAVGPTLIYAVTMENHGPWAKDHVADVGGLERYLRHLRNSDAMLTDLRDRLSAAGRSALLVFFGDHRPSIPGVSEPGGANHTPYVMLRFSADGKTIGGARGPVDLTPDRLHHAILSSSITPPSDDPAGAKAAVALDDSLAMAQGSEGQKLAAIERANP